MDEGRGVGPFDRLVHQLFEGLQRHARILELQQHPHGLPQRGDGASAEHGHGNQAAHRHHARLDQIHPGDDQQHVDHLRDDRRAVRRAGREQARLRADPGQEGRGAFVFALDGAFGALGLDRFHRRQAFDQRGVAHGGSTIGGFGQFVHLVLDDVGVDQANDQPDDRDDHQRPGNPGDDQQEDQGKRKINERSDRRGGNEITHRFE